MKIEDNIKNKLEARRMEPTVAAWDRIEGKLYEAQNKRKIKVTLWVAIAASFIAGMATIALFYSGESTILNEQFVEVPISKEMNKIPDSKSIGKVTLENSGSSSLLVTTDEIEEIPLSRKQNNAQKGPNNTRQSSSSNFALTQAAAHLISTAVVKNKKGLNVGQSLEGDRKTTMQEHLSIAESSANQEAEDLFKNVQREMISSKVFGNTTTKMDANALLLDVEAEVDPETFKDKIFKSIKINIDKAIEAVVDKNN